MKPKKNNRLIEHRFFKLTLFQILFFCSIFNINANTHHVFTSSEIQTKIKKITLSNSLLKKITAQQSHSYELFLTINNHTHWPLFTKEYLNMRLVNQLNQPLSANDLKILKAMSKQSVVIQTTFNDGNHQQLVFAFPYPLTAKAKLAKHANMKVAEQVYSQIKQSNYPALALNTVFLTSTKSQLAVFSLIRKKLTLAEAKSFFDWSKTKSKITNQVKLLSAVSAKEITGITQLLTQDQQLSLHRALDEIATSWPTEQALSALTQIANIKHYASQAVYKIDQLDISTEQKNTLWLTQLSHPLAGASAAHALAKKMTPQLANEMITLANRSNNQTLIKNSVLTFRFNKSQLNQEKLKQLLTLNQITSEMKQEISAWLN